jgi:N,N'-diacetyllegionaminate synthase
VRTLIIAEAGVNHDGDMEIARRMIAAAAQAGADLVKFQTFSADRLVTPGARKAAYQAERTGADETQHAMLRRLELSEPMHRELLAECAARGIGFLSTGFDERSVDLLASLGHSRFKIPSGEITNLPYLRHVGAYGREVLLSTGMATLTEVESALEALIRAGTPRDYITVLHCNTAYPTPAGDANLRAMATLRDALGVSVGYSDHTVGTEIALAAVALGASVIEKHFTLDRRLPGPDQAVSLEPEELTSMVAAIRRIELALGDGIKRVTPSEAENLASARKSLVAAKAIRAGEPFDQANLAVKRPGTGISPMRWDEVLGRPASRDYGPDELIEL